MNPLNISFENYIEWIKQDLQKDGYDKRHLDFEIEIYFEWFRMCYDEGYSTFWALRHRCK